MGKEFILSQDEFNDCYNYAQKYFIEKNTTNRSISGKEINEVICNKMAEIAVYKYINLNATTSTTGLSNPTFDIKEKNIPALTTSKYDIFIKIQKSEDDVWIINNDDRFILEPSDKTVIVFCNVNYQKKIIDIKKVIKASKLKPVLDISFTLKFKDIENLK